MSEKNMVPVVKIKESDDLAKYCSKTNLEWLDRFLKMVFIGIENEMESVPLIDVQLDEQRKYRIKLLEKDYITSLKSLLPAFENMEEFEKCKKISDIINKQK